MIEAIKKSVLACLIVQVSQLQAVLISNSNVVKNTTHAANETIDEPTFALVESINAKLEDSVNKQQDVIVNEAIDEFHKSQSQMGSIGDSLNFTLMPTISNLQKAKVEAAQDMIAKELLENKNISKDLTTVAASTPAQATISKAQAPAGSYQQQQTALNNYQTEYQRMHDQVIQIALQKAKDQDLKKKHPFTSIFRSQDTGTFFKSFGDDDQQAAEEEASSSTPLESSSMAKSLFGSSSSTSASNEAAPSSFITSAPSQPIISSVLKTGPVAEAKSEQKAIESMANSIVQGSFKDSNDRKIEAAKPTISVNKMLDNIQNTAQQFVNQLNKDEEKNADSYKKDIDKLKNISNHIIQVGNTIHEEQGPQNHTKLEEIKKKIMGPKEGKSKPTKSASFKMSSTKINPSSIPGVHILKDSKKEALAVIQSQYKVYLPWYRKIFVKMGSFLNWVFGIGS